MTTVRRPALALAAALVAAAVSLGTPAATAGPAPAAAAASGPYDAQPVPYTDPYRDAGKVAVHGRVKAGISRSEAQAVRIRGMRFDVVSHGGEPSARIRTTLQQVLPARPQRYRQTVEIAFDEERLLVTNLGTGVTRFVAGYGGAPLKNCHRQSSRVDGRVLTQWVPLRCLVSDTSEMGSSSTLRSVRTKRLVSSHGKYPGLGPFLRWRE